MNAALLAAVEQSDDLSARFLGLPPVGTAAWLATRQVPGLVGRDMDLAPLRWQALRALQARRVLEREVASDPPDVVYVHSHSIALGLSKLMNRIPTALSVDSTLWGWHVQARMTHRYSRQTLMPSLVRERRSLRQAAFVQAWSQTAADEVHAECRDAKVVVFHPGVDLEVYRPLEMEEPSGPLRVLFVGGRFAEKGGYELVETLRPGLGDRIVLDVVTPSVRPRGAGIRVHRLGHNDPEIVRLYQRADVLCLPSRVDSHPWVVAEALACGTPVVASDVGGIRAMLGPDAGLTVTPGDFAGLRNVLFGLERDRKHLLRMSQAARRRSEECFDVRDQAQRLAGLLVAAAR